MASFVKAMKMPFSNPKHRKLGENWTDNKEALVEGLVFYVKFLGSMLVEELNEEGQSYGDKISAKVINTIVTMSKAGNKKPAEVCLRVSPQGILCTEQDSKEILHSISIYRICFCTADKNHDKVFGFIARNTDNETMECYAYACGKKKIAHAVCLSVNQTFKVVEASENEQGWRKSVASTSNDQSTRTLQTSAHNQYQDLSPTFSSDDSSQSYENSSDETPDISNFIREPPTVNDLLLM